MSLNIMYFICIHMNLKKIKKSFMYLRILMFLYLPIQQYYDIFGG